MPRYAYERLSEQDNDFLCWESANLPMHIVATQIFDAQALRGEEHGIDFEAIKGLTHSILHRIPRYRQKLAWIPGENHAVWVDDEHFNLDYHLRHTSLPRPGSDEQLKRLSARIIEQPLDRTRPLWESWVVEGLRGHRFAVIAKVHHCMLDGSAGVDLSQILLSPTSERLIRAAPRFIPRPRPSSSELRRDEGMRRLAMPGQMLRALWDFGKSAEDLPAEVRTRVRALGAMLRWKASSASETPLNGSVCPHRIVDWAAMPLAQVQAICKQLGCSLNDVVLGIVTTALRAFMLRRRVDPATLDFRVGAPVDIRPKGERGMGNHVSSWVLRLPLGEESPRRQIELIREETRALKESHQAVALQMLNSLKEWLPFDVQSASVGTLNTIVSNVPGPQTPLYMLGAEALALYPYPPLIENLGLAIGVLSYNGQLCWGFTGDYDLVPDLGDFVRGIQRAAEQLAHAAGVAVDGSWDLALREASAPVSAERARGRDCAPRRSTAPSPTTPDTTTPSLPA